MDDSDDPMQTVEECSSGWGDEEEITEITDLSDLPSSLVVTNVPFSVFSDTNNAKVRT